MLVGRMKNKMMSGSMYILQPVLNQEVKAIKASNKTRRVIFLNPMPIRNFNCPNKFATFKMEGLLGQRYILLQSTKSISSANKLILA
jgi:hypothetical protein